MYHLIRPGFSGLLAACVAFAPVAAAAREKGASRPGFNAEALHGQTVLLFRPSVFVGEQSTAGQAEPNGDWTDESRRLLAAEMTARQAGIADRVVAEPETAGPVYSQYQALFDTVARSVVRHQFFKGGRLPTRKNKPFEWSLGPGLKEIARETGARYGLFVSTHDEYGSVGRKVFQALAIVAVGVPVTSGVHRGFAGLVDLETGDLVWLNADEQMGGDVRNAEGMKKRVAELLEDYPGLSAAADHSGDVALSGGGK